MAKTWRPTAPPDPTFDEEYPEYTSTASLDDLRAEEYAYLDATGHVYLDFAAAGLAADAQLRVHLQRLRGRCFGHPNTAPETADTIERARDTVLAFVNADPDAYTVIFTPNATGACRLVGEAYPFRPGSRLVLPLDNHDSVNGIREYARRAGAKVDTVPLAPPELRIAEEHLVSTLRRARLHPLRWVEAAARRAPVRHGLFAYPAQSNFTGVQHPLSWIDLAHEHGYDVLLDAAAYLPANPLDLSAIEPDFVAVSWYKVFGYPTGVGCLIARHEALERLRRPWFAGGTVQAVSVLGDWALFADDQSAFEDGTVNFLSIPDVEAGIAWMSEIGLDTVRHRVACLTEYLLHRLCSLQHLDGWPAILLYGPASTQHRGGTVAFTVLDPHGRPVDERAVARDAAQAGISLSTGCFANPGAAESAFGLNRARVTGAIARHPDGADDYLDLLGLPIGGAVRVSLGPVSTVEDVDRFIAFVENTYLDGFPDLTGLGPRLRC